MSKKTVLWIGDAACDTGFAKGTHYTLEQMGDWNRVVLGLNYRGDPHDYPYKIYPAARFGTGEDGFGVRRILEIATKVKPDLVVIQNDPWNFPRYIEKFDLLKERPVLVGVAAVDGKNCRGTSLNGLDHAIFWTKFGEDEARKGGFVKPASVIGLGVDLKVFTPGDRLEARRRLGIPEEYIDGFIFLNVNRNQPRKRLDLTMEYFAEWQGTFYNGVATGRPPRVPNAYLYLHVCPTGDIGYDCDQLTAYYGLRKRVMLAQPDVFAGASEEDVCDTYRSANVQVSTTQGEGWGLTTLEGMACGIPQIFPDWAALGEWAKPAGIAVPCTSRAATINRINVIGGVPDKNDFIQAMEEMYWDSSFRHDYVVKGMELAAASQYRWDTIGRRFAEEITNAYSSTTMMRPL